MMFLMKKKVCQAVIREKDDYVCQANKAFVQAKIGDHAVQIEIPPGD